MNSEFISYKHLVTLLSAFSIALFLNTKALKFQNSESTQRNIPHLASFHEIMFTEASTRPCLEVTVEGGHGKLLCQILNYISAMEAAALASSEINVQERITLYT